MKFATTLGIFASGFSLASASGVNSGLESSAPENKTLDIDVDQIARIQQMIRARGLEYGEVVLGVVSLIAERGLEKRQAPPPPAAMAAQPDFIKALFNGINVPIKERKIDLNNALRAGVVLVQKSSMSINYNEAVPGGVNTAIDGNAQLQSIPFGSVIGSGVKTVAGGVDWNGLINRDVFNGIQKGIQNVDANAVVAGGIDQLAASF